MKKKKINLCVLLVLLILVLYITLKEDFKGIIHVIKSVNIYIFILGIFILFLSFFFKSLSLKTFINEQKKYSCKNTYILTLISQFLNGITPFQTGGQPFTAYLLKKDGIRISESTSILIKDFISFQISLVVVSIFSVIVNYKFDILKDNLRLHKFIFIGVLVNVLILLFLFTITFAKNIGIKLANKIIDIFIKLRILKQENKEKINDSINNFYKTGMSLNKDKSRLLISIIYNVIHLILLYIIPFIIFLSLGVTHINVINSIIITVFIMLAGNIIPTPGATGGLEYLFLQFFGHFTKGAILSGSMLLWRFITYILPIIIGFFALVLKKEVKK